MAHETKEEDEYNCTRYGGSSEGSDEATHTLVDGKYRLLPNHVSLVNLLESSKTFLHIDCMASRVDGRAVDSWIVRKTIAEKAYDARCNGRTVDGVSCWRQAG